MVNISNYTYWHAKETTLLGNKQRQEQSNVYSKAGILSMVATQTSVSKYMYSAVFCQLWCHGMAI